MLHDTYAALCTTVGIYILFIMKTNLHRFSISIKKMQLPRFTTAYTVCIHILPLYPHSNIDGHVHRLTDSLHKRPPYCTQIFACREHVLSCNFRKKLNIRGALPPFCTVTAGFLDITNYNITSLI